jgi:hypothetical protein
MDLWQERLEDEVEMARQAEMDWLRRTPEDEALAQIERMRQDAETGGFARCDHCKQPVVWFPYRRALTEGHIYSEAGRREFGMSRLCEFDFDRIMADPEEGN